MADEQMTTAVDRDDIRVQIQGKLYAIGSGRILGAQLGQLINGALGTGRSYKELIPATQPPTLRQFCATYLSDIVHPTDEFSGPDQWYLIEGVAAQNSDAPEGSVWKAFVSINPSNAISVDLERCKLLLSPLGSTAPDGCALIANLTLNEHKDICES